MFMLDDMYVIFYSIDLIQFLKLQKKNNFFQNSARRKEDYTISILEIFQHFTNESTRVQSQ